MRRKRGRHAVWHAVRERDGVASLEFIVVLFPMILILFGVIQIGSIFYNYHQMQIAVGDTARRMIQEPSFNSEKNGGVGGTEVACSAATAGSPEDYGCRIVRIPGASEITTAYCTDDAASEHYDVTATMTLPMDDASLVDLLGLAGRRTVTATATMRVTPSKASSAEFTSLIPSIPACT